MEKNWNGSSDWQIRTASTIRILLSSGYLRQVGLNPKICGKSRWCNSQVQWRFGTGAMINPWEWLAASHLLSSILRGGSSASDGDNMEIAAGSQIVRVGGSFACF